MFFLYRLLLCIFLLFFFFKQKPAYEWRISDWSSDVCSSDLAAAAGIGEAAPTATLRSPASIRSRTAISISSLLQSMVTTSRGRARPGDMLDEIAGETRLGPGFFGIAKIGRESCRERVCQYE